MVLPTWNLSRVDLAGFDISINIESFQEMNQAIVDFYISLIHQKSHDGSYVYLTNARNYKFKGKFNFPTVWDCLYRQQSPHAWSANHPTEIYKVGQHDAAAGNQIRQVMFDRERSLFFAEAERQAKEAERQVKEADERQAKEADERQAREAERQAREAERQASQATAEQSTSVEHAARQAAEELARQATVHVAALEAKTRRLRAALIAVAGAAIVTIAAVAGWAR